MGSVQRWPPLRPPHVLEVTLALASQPVDLWFWAVRNPVQALATAAFATAAVAAGTWFAQRLLRGI